MSEKESAAVSYKEDIEIPLQKGVDSKEEFVVQSLPGKEKSAHHQKESVVILSGRSAVSVQFCAINPIR
jgi:hypothetical protein